MKSIGEIISGMCGSPEHIEMQRGDVMIDGLVCCGKCRSPREGRLSKSGRYVPVACRCMLDQIELEKREEQVQAEIRAVREMAQYSLIDERFRLSTFDRYDARNSAEARVERL